MNSLQELVLRLISDYIACAEYMCHVLRDDYLLSESLLRARRTNVIPKKGKLSEGGHFDFHGGGCFFKFDSGSIDIDFGPNDRCDGFDYYRLHDFLIDTKKYNYKELHYGDVLKKEFDKLILEGKIVNPHWQPNSHLFYLRERID